jgi:hypothetical protein
MGTQIAEAVGYKVVKGRYGYRLVDPDGNFLTFPQTSEEDAWSFAPPLDTWDGVGLVLKWLGEHDHYFEIYYQSLEDEPWRIRDDTDEFHMDCLEKSSKTVDDFPKAICEFLLEVSKGE